MKRNLLFNQVTAIGKRFAMVLTMLVVVGVGNVWGDEVLSETFIFNSTDGIKALGLNLPSSGNGTNLDDKKTYSMGIVSLTVAHGSTSTRIWNNNGTYDLRVYSSGGNLTFSVPSGYHITSIQNTGSQSNITVNTGTYSSGSWTGTASSVTYTANKTLNLKQFVIVYEAINQTIDVTLNYNGISKQLKGETSPYSLPTTGEYVADACNGDWKFEGWYGSEYESTESPTFITKLISTGSAYAIYSHTETIGGGAPTSTTTDNVFQNGTFANSTITWTLPNIVTIKQEQNGAQTAPNQNYINAPRWYAGNKITIKPDVNITTITVTTQSGYGKALSNATYGNATVAYNGTTVTITPIIGTNPIEIVIDDQARLNNLTVTYKSGGGTFTTTYTSSPECTTETTYYVTSTLSHVTAAGGNPTTVTSEDKDLTLTYLPEDGWNLPATISVTMGGNSLMLDNEYTWDKENGKVRIVPDNGFTGDIVVTINGWQQLAAPTGLNVANITSSGATLSWNTVPNASSYIVNLEGNEHETNTNSLILNELTASTTYKWSVSAKGDGSTYTDSDAANGSDFTTKTPSPILSLKETPANPIDFGEVQCGSNTPLQQSKSVTVTGQNLKDIVTVTVTGDYKIATKFTATSEEYLTEQTLSKNLDGTINQQQSTIYIIACPKAGGVSAGEGKLTFSTEGCQDLTVDLSTTVTCPQYTITWNVSGEEPQTTTFYKGEDWEMPDNPTIDCNGREFAGWTTSAVNTPTSDAPTNLYTAKEDFPAITENKTFFAVFATGGTTSKVDVLTHTINGKEETNSQYAPFENKIYTSTAVYAGSTCNSNNNEAKGVIQLRSNNSDAGIFTTTSGGKAKKVVVEWHDHTTTGRTLDIYGKNSAYTDVKELYNAQNQGTKLGSIVKDTSTELIINGEYEYIGLRSASGAMYITSISITWEAASGESTAYTTSCSSEVGYTIIHKRQDLEGNYPDTLMVHTTGNAAIDSTLLAGHKTYTGFVANEEEQEITIKADPAQNVVTYTYTRQSYTLTWDLDGGTIITAGTPAGTVKYGATLTAPTVEKTGYRFDHWNPNVPATMQDGNRTYKAFYTQQHTVKWVSQGTVIRTDTYDTGAALEAAPTTGIVACDGKTHVGWTAQGGYAGKTAPADMFTTSSGTVTADATYYAVYAEGSGGSGTGWTAVKSTYDLEAGATYAISNAANGGTYLSTWDGGNNFDGSTTTICPLILGGSEGAWTFQIADGGTYNNYYLTATNQSNNRLKAVSSLDEQCQFSISFGNNISNITCTTKNTHNILRYNPNGGSPIFACYSSGQSDVYLQKYADAGGYTNYTTSCNADVQSIRLEGQTTTFGQYDNFEFGGHVYAVLSDETTQDVTEHATFTGYDLTISGTQTVTVKYLTFTTTYNISVTPREAWHITWNVSGKINTGIGPRYVVKTKTIGECSSTHDIQIPKEVPVGEHCQGKVFVGWTESNSVNEDGTNIEFIDKNTKPDSDKTYYAVFATPNNDPRKGNYSKVTETLDDYSGEYLIVYEEGNVAFNGGLETLDAPDNTINVTIENSIIQSSNETDLAKFTITKTDGGYSILSASGKHIGQTSDANGLLSSPSTSYTNTITITEGDADIIGSGGTYLRYNKASGSERFRYYKSTTYTQQQPIALYKKMDGGATYTDYTTGCHDCIISYYGFKGGYTTSCDGDLNHFTQRVNSAHTIPNCGTITDPLGLNREFLNLWNTQPNGGKEFEPGTTFILTQDTTFYAQWALNTSGNITLPTDVEDLANTDIVVTGGNTLTLEAGTTTIKSLTLKGGIQADGSYKMPIIYIPDDATLKRKSDIIYLDLVVNAKNYYPFAVPFRAKNGSAKANWDYVGYIDPVLKEAATYRTHFVIKTYDGANRAENGENRDANWVIVNRDTYLEPGIGYMITAMTYAGQNTVTMRIPMRVSDDWFAGGEKTTINEVTRNAISVTAHTGEAAEEHQRHAGWNFVASPYLSQFAGNNVENNGSFINGEILIQPGFDYGDDNVPYVTIPAYDFSYYEQVKLSDVTLSPEYSFFVQIGKNGTMTFETAGRQQAPAHLAARAAEQPIKMDVDITLRDDNHSDQTGLIICDRYTDAYEIGHDLEKMFGSAYNLSVYTLMADNTPLAFQALAIQNSMQVIPVGYRTPAQGEYTFSLNEATSDIELLNEQYEQLILVDYETGALTNMLNNEYTFYSDRTQSNNRFALYAVPRQNTTTDLPNTIGNEEVKKVIYNDHFYILRNGKVFNGAGQIVK